MSNQYPKTLAILFITVCLSASSALAVGNVPCNEGSFVSVHQGTELYEGDTFAQEITFETIDPDGMHFNALGWRSTDQQMYAVKWNADEDANEGIVRIRLDNDGKWIRESLGAPLGAWPSDLLFDAGVISTDGTTMYLHRGTTNELYVVDLTPIDVNRAPEVIEVLTFRHDGQPNSAHPDNIHDLAYLPGLTPSQALLFAGTKGGQITILDLSDRNGNEIARADFDGIPVGPYGGARFNSDGHLVLYRNRTDENGQEIDKGEVLVVDVNDPDNVRVLSTADAPRTERFDATSCRPVACEPVIVQHAPAKIYTLDTESAPFASSVELCASLRPADASAEPLPADVEFNNVCARAGKQLYAFELFKGPNGTVDGGNRGLYRIDPRSCEVERLGVPLLPDGTPMPTELPFGTARFDAGDCDGDVMYVNYSGKAGEPFYRVSMSSVTAEEAVVEKKTATSNITGYVHDWARNPADGILYGGDSTQGHLATVEFVQESGEWKAKRHDRKLSGNQLLPVGESYGGAWFKADNILVLHRNDGTLLEINVVTRQLLSTSLLVDGSTANPQIAQHNDGACMLP